MENGSGKKIYITFDLSWLLLFNNDYYIMIRII
jgi:hypothetical protein